MNIRYDASQLQRLAEDFSNITGLAISFLDYRSNNLASFSVHCVFCETIQKCTGGGSKCLCSDNELIEKCIQTKLPQKHICHAGLVDIVVPLIKNDILLGFIMFGRIRNTDNFEDIYSKITWTDYDFKSAKDVFFKLVRYTDKQINSIISIATALMWQIISSNLINKEYDDLTERIVDFVTDNLSEDLSVNRICKQFAISKNILYEHFHSSFNCTVTELITDKRIEKAKQLLAETDLPVREIAAMCGISSYTYFFTLMKKHEGLTPSHYRSNHTPENCL